MKTEFDLALRLTPKMLIKQKELQEKVLERANKNASFVYAENRKDLNEMIQDYHKKLEKHREQKENFLAMTREERQQVILDAYNSVDNFSLIKIDHLLLSHEEKVKLISGFSDKQLLSSWEKFNPTPQKPSVEKERVLDCFHILIDGTFDSVYNKGIDSLIDCLNENNIPVRNVILHKQDKSKAVGDSKNVGYIYSADEVSELIKFDRKMDDRGIDLTFSESLVDEKDVYIVAYSHWKLRDVLEVNRTLDGVVKYIRDLDLSPFETAIFIHQYCASFKFKESGVSNPRGAREIIDIYKSDYIVCVGYAQLFKALADKLNMPGLKVDLSSCRMVKDGSYGGHANNVVHINDEKYNICGEYAEDSCWDNVMSNDSKKTTLSFCLFPQSDKANIVGSRYYPTDDLSMDEYTTMIVPDIDFSKIDKNLSKEERSEEVKRLLDESNIITSKQEKTRDDFFKRVATVGSPIPLTKFADALFVIQKKIGKTDEQAIEKATEIINRTKEKSKKMFSSEAQNCFIKDDLCKSDLNARAR